MTNPRIDVPVVEGLDDLVAVWTHRGEAAELVRLLKYGRATSAVSVLADAIAAAAPAAQLVTWVPATPARRRERGFDQAELLAAAVARRLGLKARRLLRRTDDRAQTARDRRGRLAGPTLAGRGGRAGRHKTVLVIDDVCTTGATLGAAALCLRRAGASRVVALVATTAPVRRAAHKPGERGLPSGVHP